MKIWKSPSGKFYIRKIDWFWEKRFLDKKNMFWWWKKNAKEHCAFDTEEEAQKILDCYKKENQL